MSTRPLTGNRWRFLLEDLGAVKQRIVCEATPELGAEHAKIIGHLLSDDLRKRVLIVAPGKREPNPAIRLPAGGEIKHPRWVIYDQEDGTPWAIVTGWINQRGIKNIARNVATALARPVALVEEHHGGKSNPSSDQPIYDGQIWRNFQTGARVKVINSDDRIVVFRDQSTGERGRETPKEFRWTHTLLTGRKTNARRRNPGGTMTLTKHESAEFSRAAQAMYARGQNDLGHLLSMTAAVLTVPTAQYDRAAKAYREWLVFNQPNPSRTLRAKYARQARRFAPKGLEGAGSRRTARALAAGRSSKAAHHMISSLDRGRGRWPLRNHRPGKMRVDDYNALRAALEGQLAKWPADAHSQYEAAGLSPMRFRWDLLYASKFPIMPLYAYLNDANVDTALRSILGHGPERETGRKSNPKGRKAVMRTERWSESGPRWESMVSKSADDWYSEASRLSMSGLFPPFFLYFTESTDTEDGRLYMVPDLPGKRDPQYLGRLQLGHPQPFGPNLTRDQVRARIHDISSNLPILRSGLVPNPCARRRHNPDCPCSPKCCSAQGSVCECRCGGAYHKSGRWNPRELSRVRQHGTRVTAAGTPAARIAALRQIVAEGQYAKIDGTMVDLYTASAIVQIYDALNDANRAKFASFPVGMMAKVAFKLMQPKTNPRARTWIVIDAGGRQFWQGEATDEGEALFMAERSAAGQADPPDPWLALQANPSFRVSGTIEQIPDAPPVARRGPGRPRKVRLAPLDLAPPADAVPFEVPGEAVQGGDLQPGDRVSVPYSGRASYFGRTAKHTRESGIFEGYTYENDQRLAFVRVTRGHTVETHAFPVDQVRLHGKSFAEHAAGRRAGRPAKLARLTWKAHGSLAKAEAMLEKATAEHAATEALAMELYPQHEAQPGRPRGRVAPASRAYLNARAKLRRLTERVELLGSVVRSLGGGQEYGQATGTDPWAANRRYSNPSGHKHGALKASRTVRGASRKRNPRGSERQRAVNTFRMWHEFAPHRITKMKGPDRLIPHTLVKLGDIRSIDYISDKYEGRPVTYTHKTDRPRPVLATDPDGQNLHIIGGRVKITGDGLIH